MSAPGESFSTWLFSPKRKKLNPKTTPKETYHSRSKYSWEYNWPHFYRQVITKVDYENGVIEVTTWNPNEHSP